MTRVRLAGWIGVRIGALAVVAAAVGACVGEADPDPADTGDDGGGTAGDTDEPTDPGTDDPTTSDDTTDATGGTDDAGSTDAPGDTDGGTDGDADPPPPTGTCSYQGGRYGCMPTATCAASGGRSVPGYCPGTPADIQCCVTGGGEPDPVPDPVCDETARPTPQDGTTEAPGEGGCPEGMLAIGAGSARFCVDRYEAVLFEDTAAGEVAWSPYFNPGARSMVARSIEGVVPQGYITGIQAERACLAAGKRLCTSTEWLRACRGAAGSTFPYGSTRQPGVCNDARALHPAVELFGSVKNLLSPCINQLHDGLAATGAHPGCVTAEGAFDMMGNLHEWVADAAGTFRGGFYVDTVRNGPGCLYATTAHDRGHADYSTGFRCCADAPAP